MSTEVVERLIMELGLDSTKFNNESKKVNETFKDLKFTLMSIEDAVWGLNETLDKNAETQKKTSEEAKKTIKVNDNLSKTLVGVAKEIGKLYFAIKGSKAFKEFISGVEKANNRLLFLERRLGSSARKITTFNNAAAMLGGTAEGMESTMKGLNQSIQEMVMFGDSSTLPYFNALGVGVTNANGEMREMSDILLDMSDSFSNMNKQQAYAMASSMGLDEGTTNALLQGRDAMQEMIDMQKHLYVSTEEELKASRELAKSQAYLSAQWDGMKTMIGNMLIPVITTLVKHVSSFVEFLQRNERMTRNFFEGLAIIIGVVLTPILIKATMAMAALVAPFAGTALVVAALGAAFIGLYDDYKVWSEGGKSLFDWGWFNKSINVVTDTIKGLNDKILDLIGGYKSWGDVGNDLLEYLDTSEGMMVRYAAGFAFPLVAAYNLSDALIKLYDDHKKFADGLESNVDWQVFYDALDQANQYVDNLDYAVGQLFGDYSSFSDLISDTLTLENLGKAVGWVSDKFDEGDKAILNFIGGYKSWAEVGKAAFDWLEFQKLIDGTKNIIKELKVAFKSFSDYLGDIFKPIIDEIKHDFKDVFEAIEKGMEILGKPFKWVSDKWDKFANDVSNGDPNKPKQGSLSPRQAASVAGNGVAAVASGAAQSAKAPNQMTRVYNSGSNSYTKKGGSRAWRNNNEGNIEYGPFAKKYGAIGSDGRFAIFPTEEHGRKAKSALIFEGGGAKNLSTRGDYGKGLGYRDKLLSQAITSYAPPEENNTLWYKNTVLASVGGKNKRMNEYSKAERKAIMEAMRKVEGWKEGQVIGNIPNGDLVRKAPPSIPSPHSSIIPNSGQKAANHKSVDVSFNGITINTTASTLGGATSEAAKVALGRTGLLDQLSSGMV